MTKHPHQLLSHLCSLLFLCLFRWRRPRRMPPHWITLQTAYLSKCNLTQAIVVRPQAQIRLNGRLLLGSAAKRLPHAKPRTHFLSVGWLLPLQKRISSLPFKRRESEYGSAISFRRERPILTAEHSRPTFVNRTYQRLLRHGSGPEASGVVLGGARVLPAND